MCNYTIIPIVRNPEVAPGEQIKINVFISGTGVPDKSKLYINSSSLEVENGFFRYNIFQKTESKNLIVVRKGGEWEEISEYIKTSVVKLKSGLFEDLQSDEDKNYIEAIQGEIIKSGVAPLEIKLNCNKEMSPGDYTIYFNLVTEIEKGGKTKTITSLNQSRIHIKNWYECNRKIINILALVFAIPSFVIALASMLKYIFL